MADIYGKVENLFKEQYAPMAEKLNPETKIISKRVPLVERSQQEGAAFNMPIIVSRDQGFSNSAPGAVADLSNSASGANVQKARIQGFNLIDRSLISREDIERGNTDMKSVEDTLDVMTVSMTESSWHRLEIIHLYGRSATGIGEVSGVGAGTFTLTAASWAPQIWAGSKGMRLTGNTSAGLEASAPVVASVNMATRTITYTGTFTSGSGALGVLAAGNYIKLWDSYKGSTTSESYGIDYQLTSTSNEFGVDRAVYDLFRGNSYAVGGALSFDKVVKGLALAQANGGLNEKVDFYLGNNAFADLVKEQAGLRKYDSSYDPKKFENGADTIFFRSGSVVVEFIPTGVVKDGEAFAIPSKKIVRVGTGDLKFVPIAGNGNYLKYLEAYDAAEMRMATTQAILVKAPAKSVKFTGIS
jgi:hypothetical protein